MATAIKNTNLSNWIQSLKAIKKLISFLYLLK